MDQQPFDKVVLAAGRRSLLPDEHFTVDGTLIEALRASRASNRETPILPRSRKTKATPRWTERSGVEASSLRDGNQTYGVSLGRREKIP